MPEIHGHEVMQMMVSSGKSYTRESLRTEIETRFGRQTRFYTCAARGMDADQLIDFLANRGKFQPVDSGFTTSPDKICNH